MFISNRCRKTAAKIAAALCLLSTASAFAETEGIPALINTTMPVRVDSGTTPNGDGCLVRSAKKAALVRQRIGSGPPLAPLAEDPTALRTLLDPQRMPDPDFRVRQTSGGTPHTNHFVQLDGDGAIDRTDKVPPTRSAAVPQRTLTQRNAARRGEIQTNPLIVDAPPQLRRFHVEAFPLAMPTRPVADLDSALDVLSVESDRSPAILETARNGGFGTLAIDQIGAHLQRPSSAEQQMEYPPLGRFETDLVLPPGQPLGLHTPDMADSFRQQLGMIDTGNLIEDTTDKVESLLPPLPSPTDPSDIDAITRSLQVHGQGLVPPAESAAMELAMRDTGQRVALEVDELLAASSDQPLDTESDPKADRPKPSLAEKFVGWSKRLTSGRSSAENKAVSTRLPGESPGNASPSDQSPSSQSPSINPADHRSIPQPRKRSGGILTQWFNRSR